MNNGDNPSLRNQLKFETKEPKTRENDEILIFGILKDDEKRAFKDACYYTTGKDGINYYDTDFETWVNALTTILGGRILQHYGENYSSLMADPSHFKKVLNGKVKDDIKVILKINIDNFEILKNICDGRRRISEEEIGACAACMIVPVLKERTQVENTRNR